MIKRAGIRPRARGLARAIPRRVVLVTGISGAGKSSALKAFEDLGFETVDNVPLGFLENLVAPEAKGRPQRPLAVGIDIRTRDFDARALLAALHALAARAGEKARLVFMDAADEVLQRRYAETRHRHPLAGEGPLLEGIRRERRLLRTVRGRADLVVDTSEIGPSELKRVLAGHFGAGRSGMAVFVTSFAYRHGLPSEADLVFDVRFLRNPHYVPGLKPLTGLDRGVALYIRRDRHFPAFFRRLVRFVEPLLPLYASEGKSYLTLAVGCTGGRHRSVYVAARLAERLAKRNIRVELRHRDLESGATAAHNRRPGRSRKRRKGRRL
ncbi:MAG: RNase adaptor protein RapZ [Rhodospirillales bacterium RIFCSPLOWO2_12_FULL_67_15]|nr:MAG: RNase adaptor protein RapZ [Rhodospirillales bacterium RIFCSPLOWO2_12_FULL_67_15]